MEQDENNPEQEVSLRIVLPDLYKDIVDKLKEQHIHAYDIQASAVKKENGFEVFIRFGEGFTQKQSQYFTYEAIEKTDQAITNFVEGIGKACKEIMIADYFKMMKM